jgi:hypothetical protein
MAREDGRTYRISILGAVVALVGTVGAVIVGVSLSTGIGSDTTPILAGLLAIVGSTVPSILSLVKVEQVSNDIRNGVVTEKAKEGAKQALVEHGVVTRDGPVVAAQLAALQQTLESNALLLKALNKERNDNGRPSV